MRKHDRPADGLWWVYRGVDPSRLGFLPAFIRTEDPRPMREQIDDRYISGWSPFEGFRFDLQTNALSYPGDPPMKPIGGTYLRREALLLYPHDWVLLINLDTREWEVARLD